MDIITRLGGPTAVARIVRCKPPSVSEWRLRGIPPERCPAIERALEGRFPCEVLRPDIAWVRIPDPDWPWHPDGRPLRDDTRPAQMAQPAALPGQEVRDAA